MDHLAHHGEATAIGERPCQDPGHRTAERQQPPLPQMPGFPVGLGMGREVLEREAQLFEGAAVEEHLVHRALPHENRPRGRDRVEIGANELPVVGAVITPYEEPVVVLPRSVQLS